MSKPLTYDWNGHTDMAISYPHLTNFQMAGKVRMLMRTDLDHEGVVCGARDRIMGLSKLADKQRALIETLTAALEALALDVRDYPAWQRPCHALDLADAALAAAKEQSA